MTLHKKIHIGCRQLGLEEDDRRDLYERVTGLRSLKGMPPVQQQAVVDELKRLGFKPVSKGARRKLEGKYAPKLQALWIAAWNLGIVRNKDDKALLAFIKRQAKVDNTRFLHHHSDAVKAIEALKSWLAREGGVDWSADKDAPEWMKLSGARIAVAQFVKLHGSLDRSKIADFLAYVCTHMTPIADLNRVQERDWIPIMNALGRQIREAKEK